MMLLFGSQPSDIMPLTVFNEPCFMAGKSAEYVVHINLHIYQSSSITECLLGQPLR